MNRKVIVNLGSGGKYVLKEKKLSKKQYGWPHTHAIQKGLQNLQVPEGRHQSHPFQT